MNPLDYLRSAARFADLEPASFARAVRVNLITNFTDDILKNIFVGVHLQHDVYPDIRRAPYKQYHLELKNPASALYTDKPDFTFVLFDANPFKESAFGLSPEHFDDVLADIEAYAARAGGTVVVSHFITSYQSSYQNLVRENPLFARIEGYNHAIDELAARVKNVKAFDTNRIVHVVGERHVFDLRGLYAFDIPFTHEFMAILAEEWFAYVRAATGGLKKCIVLDLDNTLWGGVVGELGATGIALGPDYPGNAFVGFQRALLDFHNRGMILAVNSKNNPEDVAEVFAKNPHMVLKEKHFADIRTNWNEKADNIREIANELNIGLDSMVFIDDDPVQRELMRLRVPEVTVPEFSVPPEDYAGFLYGLTILHQPTLTAEDREKGRMYAEERQRKTVLASTKDIASYIAELGITMKISPNDRALIPRLAQLTQKTNQCNATTRRYTEDDIARFMDEGATVVAGTVSDKFGDYGTVILVIVRPDMPKKGEATLDTFLMSCRVMGRGIECRFLDHIARKLAGSGVAKLHASFVPTAKNKPAETVFEDHGFAIATATAHPGAKVAAGEKQYVLDLAAYAKHPCPKVNEAITITK
ncbi:MAG TPA: HAD-IIIC family phosphatase [Candidatus Paceibacterota bacterium]|nr:HAD-IIIC family phosphatase [Candidatus Paceibacterota bacterium]